MQTNSYGADRDNAVRSTASIGLGGPSLRTGISMVIVELISLQLWTIQILHPALLKKKKKNHHFTPLPPVYEA